MATAAKPVVCDSAANNAAQPIVATSNLPRVEPIIGTDNEPTESGYAQPA